MSFFDENCHDLAFVGPWRLLGDAIFLSSECIDEAEQSRPDTRNLDSMIGVKI